MKNLLNLFLLFTFIWVNGNDAFAGVDADTTSAKIKYSAYPIVFYMPETNFGFGAAGVGAWRFNGESSSSRVSQLDLLAAYTLEDQLIASFDFEMYQDENKWKLVGILSYNDYFYYYFGIGIDSKFEEREQYFTKFPRVNLELYRRYGKDIYLGVTYNLNAQNIGSIEAGGNLDERRPTGYEGGTASSLGLIVQYDNRDRLNDPTKGWFNELRFVENASFLGSDFNYTNMRVTLRKYQKLRKRTNLAMFAQVAHMEGDVPFFDMNNYGGAFVGRGFTDRRFRDKNSFVFQAEVRFPIYKRFNGVVFASTGTVGAEFSDLVSNPYKHAAGLGLRYYVNQEDRQMLRLDFGVSPEQTGFYFTANNAF